MTHRPTPACYEAQSQVDNLDCERRHPSASLYLAGMVVVVNVCATVLSLLA
jgi:hypothetical protein